MRGQNDPCTLGRLWRESAYALCRPEICSKVWHVGLHWIFSLDSPCVLLVSTCFEKEQGPQGHWPRLVEHKPEPASSETVFIHSTSDPKYGVFVTPAAPDCPGAKGVSVGQFRHELPGVFQTLQVSGLDPRGLLLFKTPVTSSGCPMYPHFYLM